MEWKYQGEDKKEIPGQKFLKKRGDVTKVQCMTTQVE